MSLEKKISRWKKFKNIALAGASYGLFTLISMMPGCEGCVNDTQELPPSPVLEINIENDIKNYTFNEGNKASIVFNAKNYQGDLTFNSPLGFSIRKEGDLFIAEKDIGFDEVLNGDSTTHTNVEFEAIDSTTGNKATYTIESITFEDTPSTVNVNIAGDLKEITMQEGESETFPDVIPSSNVPGETFTITRPRGFGENSSRVIGWNESGEYLNETITVVGSYGGTATYVLDKITIENKIPGLTIQVAGDVTSFTVYENSTAIFPTVTATSQNTNSTITIEYPFGYVDGQKETDYDDEGTSLGKIIARGSDGEYAEYEIEEITLHTNYPIKIVSGIPSKIYAVVGDKVEVNPEIDDGPDNDTITWNNTRFQSNGDKLEYIVQESDIGNTSESLEVSDGTVTDTSSLQLIVRDQEVKYVKKESSLDKIIAVDKDGNNERTVYSSSNEIRNIKVSEDGHQVFFIEYNSSTSTCELKRIDNEGNNLITIFNKADYNNENIAILKDGSKIAIRAIDSESDSELLLLEKDQDGNYTQQTWVENDGHYANFCPIFDNDGNLYYCDTNESYQVDLIKYDGTNKTILKTADSITELKNKGDKLYFTIVDLAKSNYQQIGEVDLSNGNSFKDVTNSNDNSDVIVLPDGNLLIKTADFSAGVYKINRYEDNAGTWQFKETVYTLNTNETIKNWSLGKDNDVILDLDLTSGSIPNLKKLNYVNKTMTDFTTGTDEKMYPYYK